MNNKQSFRAAIYVRLSKEDGDSFSSDKNKSNSISNSKLLPQSFIDKMPNIHDMFEDNGYIGTNFERPGFQKMLEAIKLQKVNSNSSFGYDLTKLKEKRSGAHE